MRQRNQVTAVHRQTLGGFYLEFSYFCIMGTKTLKQFRGTNYMLCNESVNRGERNIHTTNVVLVVC